MNSNRVFWMATAVLFACACDWIALREDVVFKCEPDGSCLQPFMVCHEGQCLDRSKIPDAAMSFTDAGADDAGVDDAGTQVDSGTMIDAGVDAGAIDAGTDAGCVPTIDAPDDLGVDQNCDGIDGDEARAAFVDQVTGSDLFAGTKAAPYATITKGVASGKEQILVSAGTYPEDVAISRGGIYGGYAANAAWSRSAARPIIAGRLVIVPDAGTLVIDYVQINTPSASAAAGPSISVLMRSATVGTQLRRSVVVAGNGGNGFSGASGAFGAMAGDGGAGSNGEDGGQGGIGGISQCVTTGGNGGQGGTEAEPNGAAGTPADFGGDGGVGVLSCPGGCVAESGSAGVDGVFGTDGGAGAHGTGIGVSSVSGWVPAHGRDGLDGQGGSAGAGGGGGGAVIDLTEVPPLRLGGGGGGAGGAGGCGGKGGEGGQSGGASIGILLLNASPTIENVAVTTGKGGNGGSGGEGGLGSPGGAGGKQGLGMTGGAAVAGNGGTGGRGGNGGHGGPGGHGGGGPSIGIWCWGTSTPAISSVVITLGGGGASGDPPAPVGVAQMRRNCP